MDDWSGQREAMGALAMNHVELRLKCEFSEKLQPALKELYAASTYAADTGSRIWDFAVDIRQLISLGVSETDLRWLVRKGYVEHGREVTVEGDDGRDFRPTGNLTFSPQTCFVLTAAGVELAQSWFDRTDDEVTVTPLPHWDAASRRLRLNQRLVKRFKWPAANQEAVLCAFQEEGWPERIDDPLPPQPAQDPKRRLADTIKCLNRNQENELIQFHGDGTGEGILWQRIDCESRNGSDLDLRSMLSH